MAYDVNKKVTAGDLKTALDETKKYVDNALENVGTVGYYPAGSTAFDDLPAASETNAGAVYNITDGFTTTDDFLEGTGISYPAGTNISVVKDGENYKYDVYVGSLGNLTTEELTEMLEEVFGTSEDTE